MTRKHLPIRPATLLLLLMMGAGCVGTGHGDPGAASGDSESQDVETHAPADHEAHGGHAAHGPDLHATAGPGYTIDDVHFMQMMIGHHDQALRMAGMASAQDAGPEVRTLAERIDISQRDEIRAMERWLEDRGQMVPDREQRRAMQMPGMVTPEQFERLAAVRGPDFDRLFLHLMIEHHVGALEMVDELFASPGSTQDSELFQFATDVGADQLDEISIMERLLAELDPSSRSDTR